MLKVGVIGATGYTGEELIRLLVGHPNVEITSLQAIVDKECPISDIFPSLLGKVNVKCKKPDIDDVIMKADLVFLALPHTVSMTVASKLVKAGKRVIDLSADYRLPEEEYKKWYAEHKDAANIKSAVYGLPELFFSEIKKAKLIANPGCYPTSAVLAALPAVVKDLVNTDNIIIDSKTGATGAGRKAHIALCFSEINENMKAYKVNDHQHKPEINYILGKACGKKIDVIFVPHLAPLNRGILSTVYMDLAKKKSSAEIVALYKEFYSGKPCVNIMPEGSFPVLRDVQMSNYCNIGIKVTAGKLIAISCIDNLLKGAAGQAVQNMNIMYGFEETEALI